MGGKSSKTETETDSKHQSLNIKRYSPENFNKLIENIVTLDQINKNRIFYKELDEDLLDKFCKKYNQYIGIKRFCIPIIGGISCGKSTFLNYLLPFHNLLEIGNKITTKFICIIRHSKDINVPEIYNAKIEQRGEKAFNFIETGKNLLEIEGLNLEEMIKNKNNEVKEKGNNIDYNINPENYFLIIKIKIPLFEGEYEKYGELIDFIDIPGLDEVKDNFDDYIKPIFYNILFPFFIFDIERYNHPSPKKIIIKYLEYYYKMTNDDTFKKGFFILNKIDELGKEESLEEIVKDFKNIYKEIKVGTKKILLPFNEKNQSESSLNEMCNDFIPISAKNLIKQQGSLITVIIEDIIQKSNDTDFNSFKKFINNYFKSGYQLDLSNIGEIDEEEKTDEIKKELRLINNHLKKECESLNNPKFSIEEYIFIKKNLKQNNLCDDELKQMLQNKIKYLIDDFLSFEFEDLIQKGTNLNSELIKEIKIEKEFDPLKFTDEFNKRATNLFPKDISNKYKRINNIKNNNISFNNFRDNKKIRILFIGKISTGKTSLLNSIIGGNDRILETSAKECTQTVFIIKYSDNISFCESYLKHNDFGNYFEDIEETRIENISEIKEKIKKINQEIYKEVKYYSLYTPIEALKKTKNLDDKFNLVKNKDIELIDIPGFKDSNFEKQKYLKDLINLCDGFIFSFNGKSIIEDKDSQDFFSNIIKYIKEKNDCFNFNNCLFNINYIDFFKKNEIDETLKDFKKIIYNIINGNIYNCDLIEKFKLKERIKESQNINMSYFSNKIYNIFQKNIYDINNLKFLEDSKNVKLEEIYSDLKEDYEEIPILTDIDEKIITDKMNQILTKINKKDITNEEQLIVKKLAILVVSILENKEQLKKYKSSYADIFFSKFREQIIISDINNREYIINKSLSYVIYTLFKLYYINNLCSNEDIINSCKKKIEKIKKIIKNECEINIDIINNDFSLILEEDIKELEEDIIKKIEKKGNISRKDIELIIKDNQIIEQINNLIEEQKKEKMEQINSFEEYCTRQCSNLIEDIKEEGNFKIISGIVLLHFREKYIGKTDPSQNSKDYLIKQKISLVFHFYFFFLAIPYDLYQRYKSNESKISDIFNEMKEIIIDIKNMIILEFEKQENYFISNINDIEQITEEEIIFLKKTNFINNFNELITFIKENNK